MKNDTPVPGPRKADKNAQLQVFFVVISGKYDGFIYTLIVVKKVQGNQTHSSATRQRLEAHEEASRDESGLDEKNGVRNEEASRDEKNGVRDEEGGFDEEEDDQKDCDEEEVILETWRQVSN